MTAAPRLVKAVATGQVKDFKVFDNQSIKDSFKDMSTGYTIVGGVAVGKDTMNSLTMNSLTNNPKSLLGGLSGGVSFGGDATKETWLPFAIIIAIVVVAISLFAIFKPSKRRR